jgi:hypothetical protein
MRCTASRTHTKKSRKEEKEKQIMAATTKKETVEIKPIVVQKVPIRIVGDTPLIVHAWSEKAKRQMLEAQQKTTKTKAREIRRPFEDFVNSLYWLTEKPVADTDEELEEKFYEALNNGAKFGFPVGGIKQAANSAAYRMGWVPNQMALRGSYFLSTEFGEYAEIKGSAPEMREDMVRVGLGTDLRYRGEFANWYMDLTVEYNSNGQLTLEQILNCINAGGFSCGIGEWRPERDGRNGMFSVTAAE